MNTNKKKKYDVEGQVLLSNIQEPAPSLEGSLLYNQSAGTSKPTPSGQDKHYHSLGKQQSRPTAHMPTNQTVLNVPAPVDCNEPLPNDHLACSILTTKFCCYCSICAVVYSSMVIPLWIQGKYDDAKRASARAKILNSVAIVTGVITILLYIIIMITVTQKFS